MSFTLEQVVPWGRSLDEYVAMFDLSESDLRLRILGCGDGPASFNASLTARGGYVRSVDPIYEFSEHDIRARINETYAEIMKQTRENEHEFSWTTIRSVDELGRVRKAAMEEFLTDYPLGARQGRYVSGQLPHLPFAEGQFDLALCAHLLFLYSEQLSEEFHVSSLRELCRIATEVRVFPLLELGARRSRYLEAVVATLEKHGYSAVVRSVPYEFQKGGNEMVVIRKVG